MTRKHCAARFQLYTLRHQQFEVYKN